MNTLATLSNLLAINTKIPNETLRMLYLNQLWGMEQNSIAEVEGCSQSYVSKVLIKAKNEIPAQELINVSELQFTADEIKYIQFLPRTILCDVACIAFINNILRVDVIHPFFMHFDHNENIRIAALAAIGMQNKCLQRIFNKTQPTVSMTIKRNTERATTLERNNRYEEFPNYALAPTRRSNKFIIAGGSF